MSKDEDGQLALYGLECTCGRRHTLSEVRKLIQVQGYTLVKTSAVDLEEGMRLLDAAGLVIMEKSDVQEAQGRIEELELALKGKKPTEPYG